MEKKSMGLGKLREFLVFVFCFLLNTAGWESSWGVKESREECGGVP